MYASVSTLFSVLALAFANPLELGEGDALRVRRSSLPPRVTACNRQGGILGHARGYDFSVEKIQGSMCRLDPAKFR